MPNSPAINAASVAGDTDSGLWASRVLDDRERAEVREAMRRSAGDRTSADVGPGPATRPEGRWRDLPDAVRSATAPLGIAVLATRVEPADVPTEDADAIEFELLTLANEPGRLRVERRDPPEIFVAEAEIGLFRQRRELSTTLVASIREEVRRWGLKPQLAPVAGDR